MSKDSRKSFFEGVGKIVTLYFCVVLGYTFVAALVLGVIDIVNATTHGWTGW